MTTTAASLNLTVITLLITAAASATAPTGYTNYTVGGSYGWHFDASKNSSVVDYSAWAANKTFNLGDYLIFNTNSNQTVIQTFNETTFNNCSIDYASDDDTFTYFGGNKDFGRAMTAAVPLTQTGPNYFFSDAGDGIQCQSGMAFKISVNRGLGLPPSLNQQPPPPYRDPPGPDTPQLPPVTIAGESPSLKISGLTDIANVQFLLPFLFVVLPGVLG